MDSEESACPEQRFRPNEGGSGRGSSSSANVAYMFLNFFSFYQVIRPLGRKSVNKYLYLYL